MPILIKYINTVQGQKVQVDDAIPKSEKPRIVNTIAIIMKIVD